MKRPRYTAEQTAELVRLRMQGVSIAELATHVGRSEKSVAAHLQKQRAAVVPRWTPEEDAAALQGMADLAKRLGRSPKAVAARVLRALEARC